MLFAVLPSALPFPSLPFLPHSSRFVLLLGSYVVSFCMTYIMQNHFSRWLVINVLHPLIPVSLKPAVHKAAI